jgi:N utilization substance protein B
MPSRRRSRERALQVLFNWDLRKGDVWRAVDDFYETLHSEEDSPAKLDRDRFMEELVRGTVDNLQEIDALVTRHSAHWRLERMPGVDRNVLRLATFEMTKGELPHAVVIDEAIEMARRFSGDESVAFVNGVLDAVHRGIPPREGPPADAPPAASDPSQG